MAVQRSFFSAFEPFSADVGTHAIHGVQGGNGPALLMLHGYPQTHVMWHRVAPILAERFTVVLADLTGYGDSGKPVTDDLHSPYSKRSMANDMLQTMRQLGHEKFYLTGHDRGGRVAHRLAVDHPAAVEKLAVLDIAPTREMYANTSDEFARLYWHWYFLIQPAPFPENMINADSDAYLNHKCLSGDKGLSIFHEDALDAYRKAFADPDTVHASCEDYRAAASIDIDHDNEDDAKQRKIACPLLVIWGKDGVIEKCFEPLELWRRRAHDVHGRAIPGGHYLAEENPDALIDELHAFLI